MNKYVKINYKTGKIEQILNIASTNFDYATNGYVECSLSVSDEILMMEYIYKDGEFKNIGQRPNEHFVASLDGWVFDIESAKFIKSAEINAKCKNAIESGFLCDALGKVCHYPSNKTDQSNLFAAVTDSYNPLNDNNWATPLWLKDESGQWLYELHNMEQVRLVGAGARAYISSQSQKNFVLQKRIESATTKEEFDLIAW